MHLFRPDDRAMVAATERVEAMLHPAAVLLFGSRAAGRDRSSSDYDLAVLLDGAIPPWETVRRLQVDLEDVLHADVDLVVLDDASPVIAMQALREGRVLACRDEQALENFAVRTQTDYADLKISRAPIERRILEAKDR